MPPLTVRIDLQQTLSTLLATYERMERATARETEWIELEVSVTQAFVDAEQVLLDATAPHAADSDGAQRAKEHMNELVSLRKRIAGQVVLAKTRQGHSG